MVAAHKQWWLRHEAAQTIFIRGGVDPQLIQKFTTEDPYTRILEKQSPVPPSEMVNCTAPGLAASSKAKKKKHQHQQINDHQKRRCPQQPKKSINFALATTTTTTTTERVVGGGNNNNNNNNGNRSFLVNFLNLIHAFLVNRCRNDKNYTVSHMFVRQSVCLYAASSFILMLCCLVTSTEANDSSMYE